MLQATAALDELSLEVEEISEGMGCLVLGLFRCDLLTLLAKRGECYTYAAHLLDLARRNELLMQGDVFRDRVSKRLERIVPPVKRAIAIQWFLRGYTGAPPPESEPS